MCQASVCYERARPTLASNAKPDERGDQCRRGRGGEKAQARKMRRIGGRAFLGGGVGCGVEVCERTLRERTFSAPSARKH